MMAAFDPLKFSQAMEIMETVAEEAAQVIYSYYEGLIKSGFSEEQALRLTNAFQSIWWVALLRRMGSED